MQQFIMHAYSHIFLFLLLQGSKKKTKPDPKLQVSTTDISTRAGLVKMLLQPQDKMRYKDLRECKNTISHPEGLWSACLELKPRKLRFGKGLVSACWNADVFSRFLTGIGQPASTSNVFVFQKTKSYGGPPASHLHKKKAKTCSDQHGNWCWSNLFLLADWSLDNNKQCSIL